LPEKNTGESENFTPLATLDLPESTLELEIVPVKEKKTKK